MAMAGQSERDAGVSAAPGVAARGSADAAGGARGHAERSAALVVQQDLVEPAAAAETGGATAEGEAGAAGYESGAVDHEDIWEFIHENIRARTRASIREGIDEGIREGIDERIREGIRKRHEYDYRVTIPRMLARAQAVEMAFESH